MQGGLSVSRGVGIAAVAVLAIALSFPAHFEAPSPGALLQPVGNAAETIRLLQGQTSVLWVSLDGPVSSYEVQGWPSVIGDDEIGGGVMIEKVNTDAGVINFGERPMRLTFNR